MHGSLPPRQAPLKLSLAALGPARNRCTLYETPAWVSTWLTSTSCLPLSTACTPRKNSKAPVSDWRLCNESFTVTEGAFGQKVNSEAEQRFSLHWAAQTMVTNKLILLVEDNPD